MNNRSRNEPYYPQTPKPKGGAMPDTSKMVRLILPKTDNRPETTLYGRTVDDVVRRADELPEPEMNRNATWIPRGDK